MTAMGIRGAKAAGGRDGARMKAAMEARRRAGMPPRGECELADVIGETMVETRDGGAVREMLSLPGGAYARPLWALSIPQGLKEVGAEYGALVERVERGGEARCVDLTALRVDGGGAPDREWSRLDALRKLDQARAAIGDVEVFPFIPAPDALGIPKKKITARQLVDVVCAGERSIGALLRLSGRHGKGKNVEKAREALQDALDRIATEWRQRR